MHSVVHHSGGWIGWGGLVGGGGGREARAAFGHAHQLDISQIALALSGRLAPLVWGRRFMCLTCGSQLFKI